MKTFDLNSLLVFPFEEREKNVFYKADEFKMRIIELKADQELPECEMQSHVIFMLIAGKVEVSVNHEKFILSLGEFLVSEPAIFAMKALDDSRLIGIQINKQLK